MAKILVGISGGVDSSVTALLLRNLGHQVEGILLKQVSEPTDCDDYVCCAETAVARAREVCEQIGIPLHTPDVRRQFETKVITPSIRAWENGDVPSPCTTCNADLRAPLLDYYRQVLQCEYFATGHYFINEFGRVYRGVDPRKDQSYMVSLVNPTLLERWLTPLGSMTKSEVRAIAAEMGIASAHTPDSQNLCFNHLLPAFDRPVFRKDSSDRLIQIGRHEGRPAVGQRKGFGGDTVVSVDSEKIVVGNAATPIAKIMVSWRNRPAYRPGIEAQVAYHGKKYAVEAIHEKGILLAEGCIVSAGQVVAVYAGNELVGGGVITSAH